MSPKKGKGKGRAKDTRADEPEQESTGMAVTQQYGPAPSVATSSTGYDATGDQPVRKCKSIKSSSEIVLQGPLDIAGSVKSEGTVTLNGDFTIRDKVEIYGSLEINGTVNCTYVGTLSRWPCCCWY
jgi:hypothetical protein